jgi:hypothetical protein
MRKQQTLLRNQLVILGLTVFADTALAGRPLAIDDADPVEPRQFEVEVGAGYVHESDCKHWNIPFGLTYGMIPAVEIGAGFGGQFEERTERLEENEAEVCTREHGIGDLMVSAKWQVIEKCPLGARHALVPSVKFPTADDENGLGSGKTDYDLTWIASRSLGGKTGIHLNLGYSWIGGSDDNVLHYGLALDYQLTDAVQWVGEVFAEKEIADSMDTVVQYNTGFRCNPIENLTLDIAAGSRINGYSPDFKGTVGLTWAFGINSNKNNSK